MLGSLKKKFSDTFFKNHIPVPISPVDVRELSEDPRFLNYSGKRTILMNAELKHGRCFCFIPLSHEAHPFIRALVDTDSEEGTEQKKEIIKKTIRNYYENNQPESVYEWYNLTRSDAPGLRNTPPWSAPMPWSRKSIRAEKKSVMNWLAKDSKESGMAIGIEQGFTFFGPVTEKKLYVETNRLLHIYQSIQSNGYIRDDKQDGDIGAEVFISRSGKWRWSVKEGQHRSIALAALGYTDVPVRLKNIIYETEVDCWPNVLSGLYSRDGALKLFNTIYNGSTGHLSH